MSISTIGGRLHPITDPSAIPPQLGRPFPDYVAGFMFEIFLYVRKSRRSIRYQLLAPAVIMFTVSTVNVCLSMWMLFGLLISGTRLPTSLVRAKHMLYLVNNLIGDTLLLSRCYCAWSRSVYVIALPGVALLAFSVFGLVAMSRPSIDIGSKKYIYLWLTLSLNLSVTALTAGRFWWAARKARKITGPGLVRNYYSAVAIIIESGAIYSSYILLDLILNTLQIHPFILDAGLTQIVVTSPTLIIVQIGLGYHVRDDDSTIQYNNGTSVALSIAYSDAATATATDCKL